MHWDEKRWKQNFGGKTHFMFSDFLVPVRKLNIFCATFVYAVLFITSDHCKQLTTIHFDRMKNWKGFQWALFSHSKFNQNTHGNVALRFSLCIRYGFDSDASIQWWHRIDSGFDSRKQCTQFFSSAREKTVDSQWLWEMLCCMCNDPYREPDLFWFPEWNAKLDHFFLFVCARVFHSTSSWYNHQEDENRMISTEILGREE